MRASRAGAALALVVGLAVMAPPPAAADPAFSVGDPLPAHGRNLSSNDEASAVATNPANIPFLPEPELRWQFGYLGALGAMVVLTSVLYLTFKRRHWL